MAKETSNRRGVATQRGIETIAQRVARMRKEKGMSQIEMANLLGVAQSVVSDYERGGLRLHGELIIKVAEILSASADETLGLVAENGSVKQKAKGAVVNRRLLRRIQRIDSLPKRDQEALLRTIDAFLSKAAA